MARKAETFRVDDKKKEIVIYTNVEPIEAEESVKALFLKSGYAPKFEEKKPAMTVEEMRKALSKDEKALEAFNNAYAEKNGFFNACKVYAEWKKANKGKKK